MPAAPTAVVADVQSRTDFEILAPNRSPTVSRVDWVRVLTGTWLAWFNPLFWFAGARLRIESEHACDDVVLGLGTGGASYASHLVALAQSFRVHGRTWLPAPSIARLSTLERRVRAMLNPHLNRRLVSNVLRWLFTALLLAAALQA